MEDEKTSLLVELAFQKASARKINQEILKLKKQGLSFHDLLWEISHADHADAIIALLSLFEDIDRRGLIRACSYLYASLVNTESISRIPTCICKLLKMRGENEHEVILGTFSLCAAAANDVDLLDSLIELGANINYIHEESEAFYYLASPLKVAASYGAIEFTLALLLEGVIVRAEDCERSEADHIDDEEGWNECKTFVLAVRAEQLEAELREVIDAKWESVTTGSLRSNDIL